MTKHTRIHRHRLVAAATVLLAATFASGAEGTLAGRAMKTGSEPRVDNWVDTSLTAYSGPAGKAVNGNYYGTRFDLLDTTDAKQGLFAVRFTASANKQDQAFGFCSGPYLMHWVLASDFKLHAWIKASSETAPTGWKIVLYDTAGHTAQGDLKGMAADGNWRQYAWPLASLKAAVGFDFGAVRAVQVEAALVKDARIWLDDVVFERATKCSG